MLEKNKAGWRSSTCRLGRIAIERKLADAVNVETKKLNKGVWSK